MNPARAADAYQKIAEGFAELALAVGEPAAQAAPYPPFVEKLATTTVNAVAPSTTETFPAPEAHGSEAVCPAHAIRYLDGKRGPYCPATSDDPNWSNRRGYCTVTPTSAAAWLRQHA